MKSNLWLCCAGLWLLSCGAPPVPVNTDPVDTFCTEPSAVCVGNIVAKCVNGGKAYSLIPCGASKVCGNAQCADTVCEKGSRKCNSDGKIDVCTDSGDAKSVETCAKDQQCLSGVCLPKAACKAGEKQCGWHGVLSCVAEKWSETKCQSTEFCDATATACAAKICTPTTAQCKPGDVTTAQVCDVDGKAWVDQGCAAGQGCYAGVCHALIKTDVPDAGSGDGTSSDNGPVGTGKDSKGFLDFTKAEVVLEQKDHLRVTVSTTPTNVDKTPATEFENASAGYSGSLQALQLDGNAGINTLEVMIGPIEEFQTNTFSGTYDKSKQPHFGVYVGDGTSTGGTFAYVPKSYSITVTEFGDQTAGGKAKGTFTAELTNGTATLYLLDGSFDVVIH